MRQPGPVIGRTTMRVMVATVAVVFPIRIVAVHGTSQHVPTAMTQDRVLAPARTLHQMPTGRAGSSGYGGLASEGS